MAREIILTRGKVALVDDTDYEQLSQYSWRYLSRSPGYAIRDAGPDARPSTVLMHRQILQAPPGVEVDHRNHNTLDNRRENLRLATRSQQAANQRKRAGMTSRYKGVSWDQKAMKWRVTIETGGRKSTVGWYADETEAARAYDGVARLLFGEHACLNLPADQEK